MEMKNRVELVKRFDEHDCYISWSASSPAAFIMASLNDFSAFVAQKIKEQEDQVKKAIEDSKPQESAEPYVQLQQ